MFLPNDENLSGESAIAARRQRFQYVLAQSISGGVYAGQHVRSVVSHPGIEHSETYDNEFRLYCRVILDGKQADVPIPARSTIANALHYRTLHHAQGYYRRTSCMHTLGKPCAPEDYPFAVAFKTCSELSLDAKPVSPFLDDATVGPDGKFLNPDGLAAKMVELGVHVITNPPPSVFCKRLSDITMQPTLEQMTQVAVEAFRVASKVSEVKRWFAERRMHKFVQGGAKLKRRCGMVEPGVLGQVERLVAQARG